MEKSFGEMLEEAKKPPVFDGNSVWIVVDSSTCDPGKHYVFPEDRKDLAIKCAEECGWEYITDGSISDHLNNVDAINDGQTKISICRATVTGWKKDLFSEMCPPYPTTEEEEQRMKKYQEKRKTDKLKNEAIICEIREKLGIMRIWDIPLRDLGDVIDYIFALIDLKEV